MTARWCGCARTVAAIGLFAASVAAAAAGERVFDVQGHRGFRGAFPENTLAAFRAALDIGVDTLELDLQTTRDGVLVVHHDARPSARRCRSENGGATPRKRISELEWAELRSLDCGSRTSRAFPEQRPVPGAGIPRFVDVLELARGASYPVRLNVEIKIHHPKKDPPATEVAGRVVARVREYGLSDRTTIQSFHPEALAEAKRLAPAIERSILVRHRSDYDRAVARSSADVLSPRHDGLRQVDVDRMHGEGLRVIPWTVNDPKTMRKLIDWGVDGLITDYPDRALDVLAETGTD